MKTSIKKLNLIIALCFVMSTQISFSQKNNQTVVIEKGTKVLPVTNNVNCNCNAIDFKVRIFKLSTTTKKTTYRLQLIDFENKNKCNVKFVTLNWKGHPPIPFSLMKNQTSEFSSDGIGLYEFDFESTLNSSNLADESPITISFLINVGGKTCKIENRQATYFSHM